MRHRALRSLAMIVTLVLAISGLAPAAAVPATAQGDDPNLWTNETYDFTIGWSDDWAVDAEEVASVSTGSDVLMLTTGDAALVVRGEAAELDPGERLEQEISRISYLNGTKADITEESTDLATAEWRSDSLTRLVSVIALETGDANLVVTLVADTTSFDDAIASAAENITIDDAPLLASSESSERPSGQDTSGPDDAPADTATPTAEAGETPDLKLPTREPMGDGVDGDTYTSPNYGYSFEWDDRDWEVSEDSEFSEDGYDQLTLLGDNGSVTIYAFEDYDGDPAACLEGEADFISAEAGIDDWEPAENADGDPIAGDSDDSAYALFTLSYTDPENEGGPSRNLVNYLECRSIDDGVVLVISAISLKNRYNDHIDLVLEVTDTITLFDQTGSEAAETATPPDDLDIDDEGSDPSETPSRGNGESSPEPMPDLDGDGTPEATPGSNGSTGDSAIEGSVFTSPGFAFTLDIPATWSVEDEQIADGDEQLVLFNGTSTVTVWATTEFGGGDLSECVTFASEQSNLELELDVRTDGSPFNGADDLASYGAFVYEDGTTEHTYFIKCSWIEEDESALIIIQDVPTENYAAERRARRQIENSIDLP